MKWRTLVSVILLVAVAGCNQQGTGGLSGPGPWVPVVNAAGDVVGRFNTRTGESRRKPRTVGYQYPPGMTNQFQSLYE
jgi:hypothetical protein